jgi:hypothetical protein
VMLRPPAVSSRIPVVLYNREAQLRADGFPASEVAEAVEYQKAVFRTGRTSAGWDEIKKKQAKIQGRKWFPCSLKRKRLASKPCAGDGGTCTALIRSQRFRCPVLGLFGALDTSTPARVASRICDAY